MGNRQRSTASAAAGGWRLRPVIDWLLCCGRKCRNPKLLLDGLGAELLAVGAPIWRIKVAVQTTHPELFGIGYGWQRGQGAVDFWRPHGVTRTPDYIGSPAQAVFEQGQCIHQQLNQLEPGRDHAFYFELAREGGADYLALPLDFSDGRNHFLSFTTDRAGGFSADDLSKLARLVDPLAPILEAYVAWHLAEAVLDTYLGHRTGSKVLRGLIRRGDGERISAAISFYDLRDFTVLTERLAYRDMLAIMNSYFEIIAPPVTAHGGEILRFIGDAMLAIVPIDDMLDRTQACNAALDAASAALAAVADLNAERVAHGQALIQFGIGLNVGDVIHGNIGVPDRLDFTILGPAVNRTQRLESLTKDTGVPLLMSAEFARAVQRPVHSLGLMSLKGVAEPQEVFTLANG